MSITFQLFHATAVVFQINSLEGVAVGLCDFVLPVTLSLPLVACAALWTKSLIICTCWLVYALPRSERAIMYKYATHAQSGFIVAITDLLQAYAASCRACLPIYFTTLLQLHTL
jgi:hypothetical protein